MTRVAGDCRSGSHRRGGQRPRVQDAARYAHTHHTHTCARQASASRPQAQSRREPYTSSLSASRALPPAGQYGGGLPCPVNFYCPAGNVPNPTWVPVACPANTFSAAGAKDVYDCQVLPPPSLKSRWLQGPPVAAQRTSTTARSAPRPRECVHAIVRKAERTSATIKNPPPPTPPCRPS